MENVPFPEDSPMHGQFPDGFDCEGCYLNAVYTWAHDHADLFPDGIDDVGAYATKEAVEAITGLTVNYHVMVDLRGFRELVDAVGGVSLTVPERLPIGRLGGPVKGWIEPGRQHLDGYEALWFARSRATSDDYSRMGRQKCVMNAMLEQLDPRTVLTRFQEIAAASKQVATTDLPASEVPTFLRLAQRAKRLPMSSVSFVPPRVQTFDPDYDRIHAMVETAVEKAESADEGVRPSDRTHVAAGSDRAATPGSTEVADVTGGRAGQTAAPGPAAGADSRQTVHGTASLADAC
jgi:LCP family protein required for cell wall assembly